MIGGQVANAQGRSSNAPAATRSYGIQSFHDSGTWQALGAFRSLSYEEAMAQAEEFALNTYAWPFGLRVVGIDGFTSERIGGRQEIELTLNPITEIWTVQCAKCACDESSEDRYNAVRFARKHECGVSIDGSNGC